MSAAPRDSPYPELKKTHTMARTGRPWTDHKPPSAAPIWAVIEGLGRYHVLVAAVDLGVFDALDRLGPADADTLARDLAVSAPHLQRLLDAVVVLGLLDRHGDRFELDDTARRYLVSTGPACMADLVAVAPGPQENWARLADTVRRGRPASPVDAHPGKFYVPLVEGTFTTVLRTATRADAHVRYSTLDAPRLLDLGAGGAPWTIAVLRACPGATAVVNDLPEVLAVAERTTSEHGVADRCEMRPGDYHRIEIEPAHFDLVVLGHVCRAEGAAGARRLIERAHAALVPGGRLLLSDYFVDPDRRASPHAVMMGATMMANTERGATFGTGTYGEWLRACGFEAVRLIEPIGFQQVLVASRPHREE